MPERKYGSSDAFSTLITLLKDQFDNSAASLILHNESAAAHQDIRDAIPTKISELENDSGYVTESSGVKTVNGISADETGNVEVDGPNSDESLELLDAAGIVFAAASADGKVYTDVNGKIIIL